MSKIVLDNWTLELVAQSLRTTLGGKPQYNQEFISFIEAIILWDNLCYFDNGFQVVWNDRQDGVSEIMEKVLTKIDFDISGNTDIPDEIEGIVNRGALEYYLTCNRNGYGYMAVERRAEFLCDYLNRNTIPQRMRVLNHFDEVQNSYMELNGNLKRNPIGLPALFQLVQHYSELPSNYISTALQLRESKEAKQFRKIMEDIEKCDVVKQQDKILGMCAQIDKLFENPDKENGYKVVINVGPSFLNKQIAIDMDEIQTKLRCGNINLFRRMKANTQYRNI